MESWKTARSAGASEGWKCRISMQYFSGVRPANARLTMLCIFQDSAFHQPPRALFSPLINEDSVRHDHAPPAATAPKRKLQLEEPELTGLRFRGILSHGSLRTSSSHRPRLWVPIPVQDSTSRSLHPDALIVLWAGLIFHAFVSDAGTGPIELPVQHFPVLASGDSCDLFDQASAFWPYKGRIHRHGFFLRIETRR